MGLGAFGASIATVISYVVGLIYLRIQAIRITGITGNKTNLFHILVAILVGFILYLINQSISISRWYILLGIALFGLALYFGILYVIKEFKKEDIDLFRDVLHIKKMIDYIKGEIKEK